MAVAGIPLCAKAFKEAVSNLGLTKLNPEQVNALFHFLSRENVFVNLQRRRLKFRLLIVLKLANSIICVTDYIMAAAITGLC